MKDLLELPGELIAHSPWAAKSNPVWPVTIFQCRRNIARSNFPGKLSAEEMGRLFQLLEKPITSSLGTRCKIFPANRLSPIDKEFLCEHFFCSEGFQNASIGQGFAIDLQGRFFGQINLQDHLCLQWIDTGDSWEETWSELAKCEEMIAKELPYAFLPQFGFLTANLNNCGTGLTISAFLHVPALLALKKLDELLQNLEDVEAVGLEGTKDDRTADFLVVKNAYTLGLSEQEILRAVHLAATKIASAEKGARAQIQKEENAEVKDLISRAYGLLVHSYQLSTKEALASLSHLKLGIDLGWIGGLTDQDINQLFLAVRRAHLLKAIGGKSEESPEVPHQRATFIHSKLKSLQLKDDLA
jgi:protein arginine kinase